MFDKGQSNFLNALFGTLFTWGMTAAGAALVFFCRKAYRKFLDASLGFAAGVMVAASFWSLINPAIEMAEESKNYGDFAFVPVAIGFGIGAAFVLATDILVEKIGMNSQNLYETIFQTDTGVDPTTEQPIAVSTSDSSDGCVELVEKETEETETVSTSPAYTKVNKAITATNGVTVKPCEDVEMDSEAASISPCDQTLLCFNKFYRQKSWHRMLLLVIAITVHNIPEGLAVGVGFGAVGKSEAATFNSAKSLAIGIGIQNFPEGLAVSLPLRGLGMPAWKAFMWGQFSGMVEPLFGMLGCWAVSIAEPVLPYALAFAAGAMIWVVMDDIMPEAHSGGNGKIASVGSIIGFIVMMSLDVALG